MSISVPEYNGLVLEEKTIICLGKLRFLPVEHHGDLLAQPVAQAIAIMPLALRQTIGVAQIDPAMSDTAAFCQEYQISMGQSANCVILEATRAERSWLAACMVFSNTRADINGLARRTLDARKVSFAAMERAVTETGMEYGAIGPLGLPDGWPVLVDLAVTEVDYVIVGSGKRLSKLAIPGSVFAMLAGVEVVAGLGRVVSIQKED